MLLGHALQPKRWCRRFHGAARRSSEGRDECCPKRRTNLPTSRGTVNLALAHFAGPAPLASPFVPHPRRRLPLAVLLVVGLLASSFVGGAVASHVFPDVSTNSPFHQSITNVAAARCATGFPDGTFHPTEAVNRQQMAAFLNRCGGRTTFAIGSATADTSGDFVEVASDTLRTGGAAGGKGFLVVNATVDAATLGFEFCPCAVGSRIRVTPPPSGTLSAASFTDLDDEANEMGVARTSLSNTFVVAVNTATTLTISVEAQFDDDDVGAVGFDGQISAVYVPFGKNGDATL